MTHRHAGVAQRRERPGKQASRKVAGENPAPRSKPCLACARPTTAGFCERCAPARGHVITMTRDYPPAGGALSVATCSCGGFRRALPPAEWRRMDKMIRAHWVAAVCAAKAAGPAR